MVEYKINIPYLVFCWQDDAPDNAYYLDRKTGAIKLVNQNLYDLRQLTDEIEKDRERYLYLPKAERKTMIADLHDFAATVGNEHLKNVLAVAFESPHVLSAFKKILEKDESESSRLTGFLEERALSRIEAWLTANSMPKEWEGEAEDEDLEDTGYEYEDFGVHD